MWHSSQELPEIVKRALWLGRQSRLLSTLFERMDSDGRASEP